MPEVHTAEREPLAVSAAEAGQQLGVSKAHIYRLMQAGKLRYVQLGDRKVVPVAEIRRLIEGAE